MGVPVVLISPPNPVLREPRVAPPLGLLYLLGYARAQGEDVSDWHVADLNMECYQPDAPVGHWTHDFSLERCMREIPGGADVYGIGFSSLQVPHARAICRELREREPKAVLVAGGPHPSALPDECLNESESNADDGFDVVLRGEGESRFLELIRGSRTGAWPVGVWERPPPMAMDQLPIPARDVIDLSRYVRRIDGMPATNIITSRGCPGRCSFCQQESLWGRGLRLHSPQRVLEEVDTIRECNGIKNLLFLDDSLTCRKPGDMAAIAQGLGLRGALWRGWTRADLCVRPGDAQMLRTMEANGCRALCLGVEAGTDKVLRAMGKRTTMAKIDKAIRAVVDAGLDCRVSFMVGSPQETWEDVEALVRFIEGHRDRISDWILSMFNPLPGSPCWENPDLYGMVIDRERARKDGYRGSFVVGGEEVAGGGYHRYRGGPDQEELAARHAYVQEALLRLCPRDRIGVTIGRKNA